MRALCTRELYSGSACAARMACTSRYIQILQGTFHFRHARQSFIYPLPESYYGKPVVKQAEGPYVDA